MIKLKDIMEICLPEWVKIGKRTLSPYYGDDVKHLLDHTVTRLSGFDDGLTVELEYGSSPCTHLPVGGKRKALYITYLGKTQTIKEWAKETGIPYQVLATRYSRGWSEEDIFTREVRKYSNKTSKVNDIMERAKAAILEVFEFSAVGSGLHIVIDDENVEDENIQWCKENAIPKIEDPEERTACERCADLLLSLPLKKRKKLVHEYGREWW